MRKSLWLGTTVCATALLAGTLIGWHDREPIVHGQAKPGAGFAAVPGATFLTWPPDSTLFVADVYSGNRVAKFDKNGKFLLDWGVKGNRPSINCHG